MNKVVGSMRKLLKINERVKIIEGTIFFFFHFKGKKEIDDIAGGF